MAVTTVGTPHTAALHPIAAIAAQVGPAVADIVVRQVETVVMAAVAPAVATAVVAIQGRPTLRVQVPGVDTEPFVKTHPGFHNSPG